MAAESVTVVGAGAIGGWTALLLARQGHSVTLVDAWGPGNSRASSGGDTRVIRALYGRKEIYTRLTRRSLTLWNDHLPEAIQRLFHPIGLLWLIGDDDSYVTSGRPAMEEHGFHLREFSRRELRESYPQISSAGIRSAFLEDSAGYILARRGCEAVAEAFVAAGGRYLQRAVHHFDEDRGSLRHMVLTGGERLESEAYVFACGPWLPALFPDELGTLILPRRQEVFYFGPAAGDPRFTDEGMPAWAEVGPPSYYGVPGSERRGFKVADDVAGPVIDPTTVERQPSAETLRSVREFLASRFPAMGGAPLLESRVCQYSMTANRDLLLDVHPRMDNVILAGGGSGHAYKLGPSIGEEICRVLGGKSVAELFRITTHSAAAKQAGKGMFS